MTGTSTFNQTFTITHARKLAAKVVADMHQCSRLYGRGPSATDIAAYEAELVAMLAGSYVSTYEFGFQTNDGARVLSWKYSVTSTGDLEGGRSGGLLATADVSGTTLFNFMTTNYQWSALTEAQRQSVECQHAIMRTVGDPPVDGSGYWSTSRSYAAGGVAVNRQEFRPW